VTVFRFPVDECNRTKWIRSIPRQDFTPTKDAVVCIKHFVPEFVVSEDRVQRADGSVLCVPRTNPKLSVDAYPSVFHNLPMYLSSEPPKKRKTPDERRSELELRDEQAYQDWNTNDEIRTFDCLRSNISSHLGDDSPWVVIPSCDCVCLCIVNASCDPPCLTSVVKILSDFSVSVYRDGVKVSGTQLSWILAPSGTLDRWSKLDSALSHFGNSDHDDHHSVDDKLCHAVESLQELCDAVDCTSCEDKAVLSLKFITEQLTLRTQIKKAYSSDVLLWAFRLFLFSSKAYAFVRKSALYLPNESYLRRLSSSIALPSQVESNAATHLVYLQNKAKYLQPHEKLVTLMLDEIHVEPGTSFKGGSVCGFAQNVDGVQEATTVQAFMIASLLSKDRDVVALVPVANLNAAYLKDITLRVMRLVHDAGFRVLCVISDNNRVNRNMFTMLCGGGQLQSSIPHPFDSTLQLFFMFDSVHLLKCVRNNWLNQSDTRQTFMFPSFQNADDVVRRASFADLKALHGLENTRVVKLAPNLTHKALHPTNTERQKVSLALKVFNEKTVAALEFFHALSDTVENTKTFINIILRWWKMVNIKHPNQGRNLRDTDCEPFHRLDDPRLQFMSQVVAWLDRWEQMKNKARHGCLSQETHFALRHTVVTLQLLIRHLLTEHKLQYVLSGKFQTDNLEFRFSQYRQLSGGNYHVSVRQILESERKLKLISILHLKSSVCGKFSILQFMSDCRDDLDTTCAVDATTVTDKFAQVLDDACTGEVDDRDLASLVFIAGYVAHKVVPKLSCSLCKQELCTDKELLCDCGDDSDASYFYIDVLNRGGLKWPTQFLTDVVVDVFVVFKCLIAEKYEQAFSEVTNQRELLVKLSLEFLNKSEHMCECGMPISKTVYRCVVTVANIMLNNYTKLLNDKRSTNKAAKVQRKLSTLTNK